MTSKYDRLADHLAALDAPVVTLSFAAIEAVVGPLPIQARNHPSWRSATPARHNQHAPMSYW